jgi:hypothetical protein
MTPTRRSLADRDHAAITHDPPATLPPTVPPPRPTAAARPTQTTNRASDTIRISVTMTPELYNNCKAAYLADWQHEHRHDTFAAWVTNALERHTQRTPRQRAVTDATPSGQPRSFAVPSTVVEQISTAIRDDQQAGNWPTRSAWCSQALTAATNHTRDRDGGLPTPPARLPQRLL